MLNKKFKKFKSKIVSFKIKNNSRIKQINDFIIDEETCDTDKMIKFSK